MSKPRPLTDEELLTFEQSEKCQWWCKSLLLTLAAVKDEALEREQMMTLRIGELRTQLRWFEETYSVRAFAPLVSLRNRGDVCPHCKKRGVAKLGMYRACFECDRRWEEP